MEEEVEEFPLERLRAGQKPPNAWYAPVTHCLTSDSAQEQQARQQLVANGDLHLLGQGESLQLRYVCNTLLRAYLASAGAAGGPRRGLLVAALAADLGDLRESKKSRKRGSGGETTGAGAAAAAAAAGVGSGAFWPDGGPGAATTYEPFAPSQAEPPLVGVRKCYYRRMSAQQEAAYRELERQQRQQASGSQEYKALGKRLQEMRGDYKVGGWMGEWAGGWAG